MPPVPSRSLAITLKVGPSTNALLEGSGKTKHRTEKYAAWHREASLEIMAWRPRWPIRALGTGWYRSVLRHFVTDPADIDNRCKAVFDLLKDNHVTLDDKWLWAFATARDDAVPVGRCMITLWSRDGI